MIEKAEERLEKWRRSAGLFLGPIVFLLLYFISIPSLTPQAHKLAAILSLVIIFWISEAIPVTAIIGAILNVLLGIVPAKDVF